MTLRLRAVVGLVLSALIASLLLSVTASSHAAGAVIAGEKVPITGSLSPRVKRPVFLQVRTGSKWRNIARARTTGKGRYAFAIAAPPASVTYRIHAPRTKVKRKKHAARSTRPRQIAVAPQSGALAAAGSVVQGGRLTVTAGFAPARPGRTVRLQTLVESEWRDVATAAQDGSGQAALAMTPGETGSLYVRVVTDASAGAAAVISAHHKVTVTPPPPPVNPYVDWVSRTIGDARIDSHAGTPDVSADGRFVVFASDATNLVTIDSGKVGHIYLRDLELGTTTPVDVTPYGSFGDGKAADPAISADGRFVTYTSASTDLVARDDNGFTDVFMWDRESGSTRLISSNEAGKPANAPSAGSTLGNISADGRYVAYQSQASDLPGSTTKNLKIYRYDRTTFTSTMVSMAVGRQQPDGESRNATISDDGQTISFQSTATSLVAPSTSTGLWQVYRADMTRETPGIGLVSRGRSSAVYGDDHSTAPRISGDGTVISFSSRAANLVTGDVNQQDDAFVADAKDASVTLISDAPNGDPGNGSAYASAPSYDGRYVYFGSSSTNIGPGNPNGWDQAYRYDRASGTAQVMTVNFDGATARGYSLVYASTADGSAAVSSSSSYTMVPAAYSGYDHIYLLKAAR